MVEEDAVELARSHTEGTLKHLFQRQVITKSSQQFECLVKAEALLDQLHNQATLVVAKQNARTAEQAIHQVDRRDVFVVEGIKQVALHAALPRLLPRALFVDRKAFGQPAWHAVLADA